MFAPGKYLVMLLLVIVIILLDNLDLNCSKRLEIEMAVEVDTDFFNEFEGNNDNLKKYQVEAFIKDVFYEASQYLEPEPLNLFIKVKDIIYHKNDTTRYQILDTTKPKSYYKNEINERVDSIWDKYEAKYYDFINYITPQYNLNPNEYGVSKYYGTLYKYTVFSQKYWEWSGGGVAVLGFSKDKKNLAVKLVLQSILYGINKEFKKFCDDSSFSNNELGKLTSTQLYTIRREIEDNLLFYLFDQNYPYHVLFLKKPKAEINKKYKLGDTINLEWYSNKKEFKKFSIFYSNGYYDKNKYGYNWIKIDSINTNYNFRKYEWIVNNLYYSDSNFIKIQEDSISDKATIPFTVFGHTKLNNDTLICYNEFITWQKCTDSANYNLQIIDDKGILILDTILKNNFYQIALTKGKYYNWQVSVLYNEKYSSGFFDKCKFLVPMDVSFGNFSYVRNGQLLKFIFDVQGDYDEKLIYIVSEKNRVTYIYWIEKSINEFDFNLRLPEIGGNEYSWRIDVIPYCGDTLSKYGDRVYLTAISEQLVHSYTITPNPFSDFLYVDNLNSCYQTNINIRDVLGRIVYSKQINANKAALELKHLTPGIYFISINCNEHIYTKKLIKN